MYIIYPYNEILPKKTAHDVYIMNKCIYLAEQGCKIELLCGKGSLRQEHLCKHYDIKTLHGLQMVQLPIVRRNNWMHLTLNKLFFFFCQRRITRLQPNVVITSVLKQAAYHFLRKHKNTSYVYEVHGLAWYPNRSLEKYNAAVQKEREVLQRADLIIVTTNALKEVLLSKPYLLNQPIEVVPLSVNTRKLPPPKTKLSNQAVTLAYVGQIYPQQGIGMLLKALAHTTNINLEIVGGKDHEIKAYQLECQKLGIVKRVIFHGFHAPTAIPSIIEDADAFITTFEAVDGMPYVAHTKLLEYAAWGRPIIAPNLAVVKEHVDDGQGALLFEPDCMHSLIEVLNDLKNRKLLNQLQKEVDERSPLFSWQERALRYKHILEDYHEYSLSRSR